MSLLINGLRGRGGTRFGTGGTSNIPGGGGPGGGGDPGGGVGPPGGWDGTQSPTGRNPLFIMNSARQDVINQMWVDYNGGSPITLGGTLMKEVRDAAVAGAGYYSSVGQYATYMYQATGDVTWAQLAYSQFAGALLTFGTSSDDINTYRDYVPMHIVMLDWLWPGLTPSQRTTFLNFLVGWMDHVNGPTSRFPWADGALGGDSDQIQGHYAVIALLHLSHPENSIVEGWWNNPVTGGLDSTASQIRVTARNAMRFFYDTIGLGGEYIEGGDYSQRTVGHNHVHEMEAIATATGARHFPEWDTWLQTYALNIMAHWTPDLELPWGWGDWQSPYEKELTDWSNTALAVAGALQGTTAGEQLQQFILDMVAKYGVGPTTFTFMPKQPSRWFGIFNPYAPAQAWKTEANKRSYYAGKGVVLSKTGYTTADSLFAVDSAQWVLDNVQGSWWVDHFVQNFMASWLYKNGEWLLKTPFGYDSLGVHGPGQNTPLMHGLNMAQEYKRVQHHVLTADYDYVTATTGGSAQDKEFGPAVADVVIHEWTRSYVRIPGITDVIICYDRAYVKPVPNINDYFPGLAACGARERIEGSSDVYHDGNGWMLPVPLNKKQLLWHMPVNPSVGGQDVSWTSPGGQAMKLTQLLPATTNKVVRNELTLQATKDVDWNTNPATETFAYHVIIYPTATQDWDTFLGVMYCGGTAGALVSKSNGGWEGVHGTRPGQEDFLVMFNATQGATLNTTPYHASHLAALTTARLRNVGFTVSWTAVGAITRVILNDLDPNKSWTVNKDGAGAVALSVDSGGHATFTIAGAGAHSVVLA